MTFMFCTRPAATNAVLYSFSETNFTVIFPDDFIIGRVIKAMNANWHPDCFTCELCNKQLADVGFLRNLGRLNLFINRQN